MDSFADVVVTYSELLRAAATVPLGGYAPLKWPPEKPDAPKVLMAFAHPDDECLSGASLGIRLKRDLGCHVCNLGVTLGREAQRKRRRGELEGACNYLGFELLVPGTEGFDKVYDTVKAGTPSQWTCWVDIVADILLAQKPKIIITHHSDDWHPEHIGVNLLMVDAMAALGPDFRCTFVETEYWRQMPDPNLMLEVSAEDVVRTLKAVSFHSGELERNPYHLRYPALLSDNVRRCEVVTGRGTGAPDWDFAIMLRVRRWQNGQFTESLSSAMALDTNEPIFRIFS